MHHHNSDSGLFEHKAVPCFSKMLTQPDHSHLDC